jgi:Arc/MetJ-type ribon-helix-helix transcriptional regulator
MPSQNPDPSFHLLRVRVRKGVFARLQEVAQDETIATGEYTTVSDIVRSAIFDWLTSHDADVMFERQAFRPAFAPSGVEMPALDTQLVAEEGEDLDFADD